MRRVSLACLAAAFWISMAMTVGAQTTEVETQDNKFAPETITVEAGGTITFKNTGKDAHTATAEDKSFDTGNLSAGQSKTVTVKTAGTFKYICIYHESLGMVGTITVTGAAGEPPAGIATPSPAANPTSAAEAATSGDKDKNKEEATEAPAAKPPSEKYFPMAALGMLVGGMGLIGLGYLKNVLKTADRGR